jgi:hypothetical protein
VLSFGFNATTSTLRLRAFEGELERRVRDYLDEHPAASANEVDEHVEGNRNHILELVRQHREGGSESSIPPGTTTAGSEPGGGSASPPLTGAGTTPVDFVPEVVPDHRNHDAVEPLDDSSTPALWDHDPSLGDTAASRASTRSPTNPSRQTGRTKEGRTTQRCHICKTPLDKVRIVIDERFTCPDCTYQLERGQTHHPPRA